MEERIVFRMSFIEGEMNGFVDADAMRFAVACEVTGFECVRTEGVSCESIYILGRENLEFMLHILIVHILYIKLK